MPKCVIAGVFDPFTNGHKDLVMRAAKQFETVFVAVSDNAAKSPVLDGVARAALAEKALANCPNVTVVRSEGLLADFCRETGASCIVKGVRPADFAYEYEMFLANNALSGIDTFLLPAKAEYLFLSSTFVRELLKLRQDISAFVPAEIHDDILALYSNNSGFAKRI